MSYTVNSRTTKGNRHGNSEGRVRALLRSFNQDTKSRATPKIMAGFTEFMDLNHEVKRGDNHSSSARYRIALLKLLRTNCVKWHIEDTFNHLLFNLNIPELSLESKFSPFHLYDLKNAMFYSEVITSDNIELYSFHSRMMIRRTNRLMFSKLFNKYMDPENDREVALSYEDYPLRLKIINEAVSKMANPLRSNRVTFNGMIKSFVGALKDSPKVFSADYNFEYLNFIVELGLLNDKDTLMELLQMLSVYIDDLYEEKIEEMKHNDDDLSYSDDLESDEEDNSVSTSSFDSDSEEENEPYSLFDFDETEDGEQAIAPGTEAKGGHGGTEVEVSSNANDDHHEIQFDPDTVIYHSRDNEMKKLGVQIKNHGQEDTVNNVADIFANRFRRNEKHPTVVRIMKEKEDEEKAAAHKEYVRHLTKMSRVAGLTYLIVVSLSDLETFELFNQYSEDIDFFKQAKKDKKPLFFFQKKTKMKLIVNIAMKILGTLHSISYMDNTGIETFVSDDKLRKSINQMLMTILSVRNDPLVRSHDTNSAEIQLAFDNLDSFVGTGIAEFEEIREDLQNFFVATSNSIGDSKYRKREKKRHLDLKDIIDSGVFTNLEQILKKIAQKFEKYENDQKLIDFKIQASLMNIPDLVMSIISFFVEIKTKMNRKSSRKRVSRKTRKFDKNLDLVMDHGVSLLVKILKGNYLGQGLFFNGKSAYLFWSVVENCPIVFLSIIEQVLDKDSSIVFKSPRNSEILFSKLKGLVTHNLRMLNPRSTISLTNHEIDVKRIEIYLANTLLDKILKDNVDNSEERLLAAKIHEFLQQSIDECFIDYFNGADNTSKIMEHYRPVLRKKSFQEIRTDVKAILSGQKTSRAAHGSRRSLDQSSEGEEMTNSEAIEAEMHLSFVKLFNEVTESWKHMTLSTRHQTQDETWNKKLYSLIGFTKEGKFKNNLKLLRRHSHDQHLSKSDDEDYDEDEIDDFQGNNHQVFKFEHHIENGVPFLTELIRLYCNEQVFEFNEDLIKMRNETMLAKIKDEAERIAGIAGMINDIESTINEDSDHYSDYRDFLLQGYFKVIYKFLKGVLYELSKVSLCNAQLELIFMQMTDLLRDTMRRLLPRTRSAGNKLDSELYEQIDSYIYVKTANNDESFEIDRNELKYGSNKKIAKGTGKEDSGMNEDKRTQNLRYKIIDSILNKIEQLYQIYGKLDVIKDLSRETHKFLQENPSNLFNEIDITGSHSLRRLKEKFKIVKKRYANQDKHLKRSPNRRDTDALGYSQVAQRVAQSVENEIRSILMKKRSTSIVEWEREAKVMSVHAKNCEIMNFYIRAKETHLFGEDNLFYKMMDEGGDDGTESEEFYKLFLTWVVELFYVKLNPDKNQFTHPESNFSILLRDTEAYSWVHIMDNIMTKKPQVREILYHKFFLDSSRMKNEILAQNPEAETAYLDFTQYQKSQICGIYSQALDAVKLMTQNVLQGTIYRERNSKNKTEELKFGEIIKSHKPEWTDEKFRKKRKKIMKADIFLSSLFETAFYLQRCIRSEVFSRTFSLNMEYYFSLTGLIKTLAEDNFIKFKELVGKMRKQYIKQSPDDDHKDRDHRDNPPEGSIKDGMENHPKKAKRKKYTLNYLDFLYKGVYLHTKVSHELRTLVRRDRPHLFWYNIVTMDTLSEYFNGPCLYNQNNSIKKFKKLLMFVSRLNKNESNTFYLVQLEIITLLQALFEGENKIKCSKINKHFKPFDFYNMIVKHLQMVYTYYLKARGKSRMIVTKKAPRLVNSPSVILDEADLQEEEIDPEYFDSDKLSVRLIKYYKLMSDFKEHPILNISVGLFIIMQTIAKGNNKNYQKYLSDKKVEMAVVLGHIKHLKLSQSEKSQVELQTNQQKKRGLFKLASTYLKRRKKKRRKKPGKSGGKKNLNSVKRLDSASLMRQNFMEEQEEMQEQSRLINLTYFYFLTQITASIEILNKQREPVTVYFQILPECMFLTEDTKNIFLDSCTFSDANSKLMSLMERVPYFRVEMESNLSIYRSIGSFSDLATESTFFTMMKITWFSSLLVNISVVIGYQWEDPVGGPGPGSEFKINEPYFGFNLALGIMLIIISFIFLFIWIVFKYKFALKQATQNFMQFEQKGLTYNLKKYVVMSYLQQPIPMMFTLHIIFTSIGLVGHPLFHSLNLYCLFFLSETAQYVVKAITSHIDQVLMTLLVGVVITYSFSIINAMDYRLGWDELTAGELPMCQTMLGCFGYVLDFGLRNGGGIADSHDTVAFLGNSGGFNFWYKIGFNLLFFILISKFVLDIIFGIIVDSFTDMRDNQQKRGE